MNFMISIAFPLQPIHTKQLFLQIEDIDGIQKGSGFLSSAVRLETILDVPPKGRVFGQSLSDNFMNSLTIFETPVVDIGDHITKGDEPCVT